MRTLRSHLSSKRSEEGFTLIELMIVVVIIGILAAIAIPIFANQQKAAIDARTLSDIRTANAAINGWKASNPSTKVFNQVAVKNLQTYSEGTMLAIYGIPNDYCIKAYNPSGDLYNSNTASYGIFVSSKGKIGASTDPALGSATSNTCNDYSVGFFVT